MATKYNIIDDIHYGSAADKTALGATLTVKDQNLKFWVYEEGTLYVWSGSAWFAM